MIIVKWFIMFLAENKNTHLFAASPIIGYFYDTGLPESSWFLIDICTKAKAFEIIPALFCYFWLEFAHLVEHLNQEKWINMWIIFILSSTGGWAVNSLSKLHVSLATAGLNGAATVPCSDHHLSSSDVAQLFLPFTSSNPFQSTPLKKLWDLRLFSSSLLPSSWPSATVPRRSLGSCFGMAQRSGGHSLWKALENSKQLFFTFFSKAVIICWASGEIIWKSSKLKADQQQTFWTYQVFVQLERHGILSDLNEKFVLILRLEWRSASKHLI